MREIKFRAQKRSDKKIIYGNLITDGTKPIAIVQQRQNPISNGNATGWCFSVLPETVEEFTGFRDKNGKEIFEGDTYHQGDENIKYKVIFKDGCFIGNQIENKSLAGLSHFLKDIEVIGKV